MRTLLAVLMAMPFCAGSAFGWGCDGHQIVAMIARAHLTPAVSAAVDRILAGAPLAAEHSRFCQDTPTDPMAVAAPWADDVKSSTKTFLWHQIDIPLSVTSGDYRKWCAPIGPSVGGTDRPGCIINAIPFELEILLNPQQSAQTHADALRYLIHFFGDLSQPLHVSDNRDEGGNCTSFRLPFLDKPTTLHGIWDFDLITRELKQKNLSETDLAAMLDEQFADRGKQWLAGKTNVEAWAWEAHKLAATFAYGLLNPSIPVARPDAGLADKATCDLGRRNVAEMNIAINQNYMDLALSTIHEQLAKAGYRLAGLLNETLR
jgi:hypothetical protein